MLDGAMGSRENESLVIRVSGNASGEGLLFEQGDGGKCACQQTPEERRK